MTWQTKLVMGICENIYKTKQYDQLPVLADAMEEAGCSDAELLSLCRRNWGNDEHTATQGQMVVCLVLGGDYEEVVRRVEEIATKMGEGNTNYDYDVPPKPLDYVQMMEGAKAYLDQGDYVIEYGDENWRNTFPQYAADFWKCYEIITGVSYEKWKEEKPEERQWERGYFFSCSC